MSKENITLDFIETTLSGTSPQEIFTTSSFQSHSIVLLHLLHRLFGSNAPEVVITNTGYLFPETLLFAAEVCDLYSLKLKEISSNFSYSNKLTNNRIALYATDPDLCCKLNKTEPLINHMTSKSWWINGIRRDQTAWRKELKPIESTVTPCKRLHPMLDWNSKDIYTYSQKFDLPTNPLENIGYFTVGCEPCTAPSARSDERSGRWMGLQKTECGINTDLIVKA